MDYEPAWDRLLASLRTWADAREVPGGIEVSYADDLGANRTVAMVMTPDAWEELSEVMGRESPASIKERLLALENDKPFLVCDSGVELIASSTRELPPDDSANFAPEPGGQWIATDRAGNVLSRFADYNEDHS